MSEERKSLLTKKDLNNAYFRLFYCLEMSNSYERMQGPAFCNSISKVLKKLYTDHDEYCAALARHLEFFNSEGMWGSAPILGITIAMEEERAQRVEITDEAINGLKVGLMGPLAGVGDTIDWATLKVLLISLGCAFSANGSPVGALSALIFYIVGFFEGWYLFNLGYNLGATAVGNMLASGVINEFIEGASILGLFMMGALGANTVSLSTPLAITVGDLVMPVQTAILDGIVPGILPLAVIMLIWWYMKKGKVNYNALILTMLAVSLIGSFIGIF